MHSPTFRIPGTDGGLWRLRCYPHGHRDKAGTHLALFLCGPASSTSAAKLAFQLFVAHQMTPAQSVLAPVMEETFGKADMACGTIGVVPLERLREPGFVEGDTLIVGLNACVLKISTLGSRTVPLRPKEESRTRR